MCGMYAYTLHIWWKDTKSSTDLSVWIDTIFQVAKLKLNRGIELWFWNNYFEAHLQPYWMIFYALCLHEKYPQFSTKLCLYLVRNTFMCVCCGAKKELKRGQNINLDYFCSFLCLSNCSIQIAFSFKQWQHIVQCLANPGLFSLWF